MVTYTHIDYNDYMTTVIGKVKKIKLSKAEIDHFGELLDYEIKNGQFSVYKIYSYFKKKQAYKNIHQNTQRLFSLGLIEEVEGELRHAPHGAKFYRLSINGWFNAIMNRMFEDRQYQEAIIKFYDTNIFFKTFLSPYFESKTIEYHIRKRHYPNFSYYLVDCCDATSVFYDFPDYKFPDLDLEKVKVIKSMVIAGVDTIVMSFLIKILRHAIFDYTYFPELEGLSILSNDKRFLGALKATKINFEESYKMLKSSSK